MEIRSRKALLASAGSEFDLDLTISAAERLKISRANVKESLGLGNISGMEDLEKELVKDEDLVAGLSDKGKGAKTVVEPVIDLEKLSARERIAMKRKARLNSQGQANSKQVKKPDEATSMSSNSISISISNTNSSDNSLMENNFDSIGSDALWFCEKMKEKLLK